jgi:hypothetical protein
VTAPSTTDYRDLLSGDVQSVFVRTPELRSALSAETDSEHCDIPSSKRLSGRPRRVRVVVARASRDLRPITICRTSIRRPPLLGFGKRVTDTW